MCVCVVLACVLCIVYVGCLCVFAFVRVVRCLVALLRCVGVLCVCVCVCVTMRVCVICVCFACFICVCDCVVVGLCV